MYLKSLVPTSRDIEDESAVVKRTHIEYVFTHFNLIALHNISDLQIKNLFWKKYKNMKKFIKESIFEKNLREIPLRKCMTMQMSPEICLKCYLSIVEGGDLLCQGIFQL